MSKKLTNFYTRFYVYVNQVFGDDNVRKKILEIHNLQPDSFKVIQGIDRTGDTWTHHVAMSNKKEICSVKQGVQDIDTEDTACQSYSIYNLLHKFYQLPPLKKITNTKRGTPMRQELVKENTQNVVSLLSTLLKNKEIKDEINSLLFERMKGDDGKYLVSGKNQYVDNIIQKLKTTLTQWAKYGYQYFL